MPLGLIITTPALAINSTRVAAVHGHEPGAIYSQIGFPDFLTQLHKKLSAVS